MNEFEKSLKRLSDLRENYHKDFGEMPEELESLVDALEREIVFLEGMLGTVAQYFYLIVHFTEMSLRCIPDQTTEVREAIEACVRYKESHSNETVH